MTEIDDDLQGLLAELDIGPEILQDESLPLPLPVAKIQEDPGPVVGVQEDSNAVLPIPILEDPGPLDKKPDTDLFNEEELSQDIIDLREFIIKHDKDYEETKANLRADRAKADELVRILLERVDTGGASTQETESLVQAIKCLVDTNGHMVRLLDSKSKLLTASKGNLSTLIQQNFGGGRSNAELETILTQQIDENEV